MISGLVVPPSSASTACAAQKQGELVRRLGLLTQIGGNQRRGVCLNLCHQEPKNLRFNVSKRCSSRISASLLANHESDVLPDDNASGNNGLPAGVSVPSSTNTWDAFCRFTRPYTIYRTIVGVLSMALLPVQTTADLSPAFFIAILQVIVPTVLMNIYTSAVNQITDIEIDKINKPHLPLASGEFSLRAACAITFLSAIVSIVVAVMLNSPPLIYGILALFFIGTAYSVDLPFLRWKANAFLAPLYFILDMAILHPVCLFAHFQKYILGRPLVYTKPLLFTIAYMMIVSPVLAIIKDLPDVVGDRISGRQTATVIFGEEKVFWSCVYALMATYCGAAIFGATSSFLPNKIITVLGHGIVAAILWYKAKMVNTSNPSDSYNFYVFLWKLVYVEYLLLPFVR